jgi:hypothetical protein
VKNTFQSKSKAARHHNSHATFSTNTRSIIASLYGSLVADEQLVLTGNAEFGKLYGKTKGKFKD